MMLDLDQAKMVNKSLNQLHVRTRDSDSFNERFRKCPSSLCLTDLYIEE